jgi:hypothetical protein
LAEFTGRTEGSLGLGPALPLAVGTQAREEGRSGRDDTNRREMPHTSMMAAGVVDRGEVDGGSVIDGELVVVGWRWPGCA